MSRKRAPARRKPRTDCAVGYGQPPLSTRFRPGQSGNPKGRPKGARNTESIARDALEQTVSIKAKGVELRRTVRELAFQSLAEKAASGDIKSLDFLLALEKQDHRHESDQQEVYTSSEQALEIVKAFLDRQRVAKGDKE